MGGGKCVGVSLSWLGSKGRPLWLGSSCGIKRERDRHAAAGKGDSACGCDRLGKGWPAAQSRQDSTWGHCNQPRPCWEHSGGRGRWGQGINVPLEKPEVTRCLARDLC